MPGNGGSTLFVETKEKSLYLCVLNGNMTDMILYRKGQNKEITLTLTSSAS